jgi:ABC-2 type transport system ATP-binding protein
LLWLAQSNRIARQRVGEVLEMVGLTGAARRRVGMFSLGMGQRLGLAAALLGDPPVLVLDEPVNGLDAEGIRWLRELLRAMAAEGRTVLVSSHLMTEMSMVADHLIVIHHGQLLADTSMSDFIQRYGRTYVRVRTPDPRLLGRELERKGASLTLAPDGSLEVGGMSAAEINRLATANGLALDELSTHTGSLEEIFLGLVGKGGGSTRV